MRHTIEPLPIQSWPVYATPYQAGTVSTIQPLPLLAHPPIAAPPALFPVQSQPSQKTG